MDQEQTQRLTVRCSDGFPAGRLADGKLLFREVLHNMSTCAALRSSRKKTGDIFMNRPHNLANNLKLLHGHTTWWRWQHTVS